MLLVGLLGRDGYSQSAPSFAGRANRARSRSLGGGLPVSAEISLVCKASSSGVRR